MGFKCGIVGLPNVGKSTLFNALTKANIEAQNYPFCTIEPNVGIVAVPDPRLDALTAIVNPKQTLATTIEFVDIAGLVAGAHKGEGLGNQFLAHIRETDAIAHIVRCFNDDNVTHVSGDINPLNDIEVINTELLLADLESIEKRITRLTKKAKGGDKEAVSEQRSLEQLKKHIDDGSPARSFPCLEKIINYSSVQQLITVKPIMYVANVSEDGFADNPLLSQIEELANKENASVIPICANLEAEIADLEPNERDDFLADLGLEQAGLARVLQAGYKLLGLITFFTAGPKEVRAWTVQEGASAPNAAGCIHTDFEKGFIRAEVISYEDFIACNGEQGAKEAGKWRLEGKDYLVCDGDVVHFRFNV